MKAAPERSGVRLDKWLWAARLFKTRSLAGAAVEGGKVHLNGARTKPSKSVAVGDTLRITQGLRERVVVVRGLTSQRRPASEAAALYEETPESEAAREQLDAERRQRAAGRRPEAWRPSKKERRDLRRLKTARW